MSLLKKMDNPYTLQFSYIPPQIIERNLIITEIAESFLRKVPTYRSMFITGIRGSGKTVMLGEIRSRIAQRKDWIVVDLNPESDLIESLARRLYLEPEMKALFIKAKLDFSVLGIGVQIEGSNVMASNEEDALIMMLRAMKKAGKKLLVTIDEVTYSKDVARFSHALSSYSGENFDIYVIMTGLIENIKNIKNKPSLTFLYRAKIQTLDSLNITAIRADYQKTLKLDMGNAEILAYKTRGYPLAFQAVGYLYWDALSRCEDIKEVDDDEVDVKFDTLLSELAYDKIWDELSANDRRVLAGMLNVQREGMPGGDGIKVEDIRREIDMSSDVFTKYRSRLVEGGILDGSMYGHLKFCLPRFEQYIENRMRMDRL